MTNNVGVKYGTHFKSLCDFFGSWGYPKIKWQGSNPCTLIVTITMEGGNVTMIIKGRFEVDNQGFTRVYSNNKMFEINRYGDYGVIAVGQMTATNHLFTQEVYDKWASECTHNGTFELEE